MGDFQQHLIYILFIIKPVKELTVSRVRQEVVAKADYVYFTISYSRFMSTHIVFYVLLQSVCCCRICGCTTADVEQKVIMRLVSS